MNSLEKLEKIFSPLDVVYLTKEYEYLSPKGADPDLPPEVQRDIYRYLTCGENFDRNPSVWIVFKGEKLDTGSDRWIKGMMNLFRLTCKAEVSEIANDNNHVRTTLDFVLLAVNAKFLPEEALKELKCAKVETAFGTFPLELK